MYPISYEMKNSEIRILFSCVKCGKQHRNKRAIDDEITCLPELIAKYRHFFDNLSLQSEQRKKSEFSTTFQLKDFLTTHHFNQKKIAVIFQVIRIMVNRELEQLEQFLEDFPQTLKKG